MSDVARPIVGVALDEELEEEPGLFPRRHCSRRPHRAPDHLAVPPHRLHASTLISHPPLAPAPRPSRGRTTGWPSSTGNTGRSGGGSVGNEPCLTPRPL